MKEKYFASVRMFVFIVSALGMIMVVGGVVSDLSNSGATLSNKSNNPEVKFSDFKEFKNYTAPVEVKMSASELKKEQDKFHGAFLKHSQNAFTDISKYSLALSQDKLNQDRFDEYLFKLLTQYDMDLRISYLEQLSAASSALVKYADEVNSDRDKKTILWSEFLDWFSNDFNDQLQTEDEEVVDENIFLSKEMLVIFMLLVIILLLSRFEAQSAKEEIQETNSDASEEDVQDESEEELSKETEKVEEVK